MAGYASDAVARAVKLTSQLLAFSRNQNLVLKPVDIDQLVRNMDDLLSRSLGHTAFGMQGKTPVPSHAKICSPLK